METIDKIIKIIINLLENNQPDLKESFTESTIEIDQNTPGENKTIPEKKKIFYLIILLLGGIFIYYTLIYLSPETPPIFSIVDTLDQIKKCIPEKEYELLLKVIQETEERPDKLKAGIELLKLLKIVWKNDEKLSKNSFEILMEKIIKYFEEKDN